MFPIQVAILTAIPLQVKTLVSEPPSHSLSGAFPPGKMFWQNSRKLIFRKFQVSFRKFSKNLKINRKPWENDFGQIS